MLVSNLLPGFTPFLLPTYEFNDIGEINAASLGSDIFVPPPVHRRAEVLWHPDGRASVAAPKEFLRATADEGPKNPSPPDKGALRYDALEWQREGGRSLEEALLVKVLAARIRLALWSALSEGEPTDVSRAILKGDRIAVKITQTHDGLRDYEVALFADPVPGRRGLNQVLWSLDLRKGHLEPISDGGHELPHSFGSFYRGIRFRFVGLTGAPLIQALPPQRLRQLAPPPPEPVRDALRKEVRDYCERMGLPEAGRLYLLPLADAIFHGLSRREGEDPAFRRLPIVHVWIRDHRQEPSEANVEVNRPGAFIGRAPGPHDILLVLTRFIPRLKDVRPYLEMHGDLTQADRLHSAEAWFLKKLGLLPNKLIIVNLESLHPDFKPV